MKVLAVLNAEILRVFKSMSSTGSLNTSSTDSIPEYRTPKCFNYRQYSRVSNPKLLEVQSVSRVFYPEILSGQAVSRVLDPELLEVQAVYRVLDPEIHEVQAVSRVVLGPKILRVQAESEVSNLSTAGLPTSNTF